MIIALFSYLLASSLAAAALFQSDANTESYIYDSSALERVRVSNVAGKITISPMTDIKPSVNITKRKFTSRCSIHADQPDPTQIVIEVKRPLGETCEADIELRLPKALDLDVTSSSGDVKITGIQGALKFNLSSGTLLADGHFRKIDGTSGSGNVDVKGLAGGGSVDVGSGKISLTFLPSPQGKISVKDGSGDLTLLFPKDTKLKTALTTGSGDLSNEFDDRIEADFNVSAKTGSGDLRVKSY